MELCRAVGGLIVKIWEIQINWFSNSPFHFSGFLSHRHGEVASFPETPEIKVDQKSKKRKKSPLCHGVEWSIGVFSFFFFSLLFLGNNDWSWGYNVERGMKNDRWLAETSQEREDPSLAVLGKGCVHSSRSYRVSSLLAWSFSFARSLSFLFLPSLDLHFADFSNLRRWLVHFLRTSIFSLVGRK